MENSHAHVIGAPNGCKLRELLPQLQPVRVGTRCRFGCRISLFAGARVCVCFFPFILDVRLG